MRERLPQAAVRCAECDDEWLQGRMVCRVCRQPLRIRHRDLAAQVAAYAMEEEDGAVRTGHLAGADWFVSWVGLAERFLVRRVGSAPPGSQ